MCEYNIHTTYLLETKSFQKEMKRCMFITKIAYPFGGGEKYLYDVFQWMESWGYDVLWIAFCDKFHQPFPNTLWKRPCVCVRGEFTKATIQAWIQCMQPDVIHTQGVGTPTIVDAAIDCCIPICVGFHFWTHLITLGSSGNRAILDHIEEHKLDPFYTVIQTHPLIHPYVCSEFINTVVEQLHPGHHWPVLHPTSNLHAKGDQSITPSMITQLNTHPLKGGEWLPSIVKQCPQYSFCFVDSEPGSNHVVEQLNMCSNVTITPYVDDVESIYQNTRILLVLSLVDETYGRVAYEGLYYGIPMITTGKGHLRSLCGDGALYVSSVSEVVETIKRLDDPVLYQQCVDAARKQFYTLSSGREQFREFIEKHVFSRILILAPYSDQGLGIQTRRYRTILKQQGFSVFIFSYRSYYSQQINPNEWDMEDVFVSSHIREDIPFHEIKACIVRYSITHCIIPETCFSHIFEVASFMRSLGCKVIAIPNVEIIRHSELAKHRVFHECWLNNQFTYNVLKSYSFLKIRAIGYPILAPEPIASWTRHTLHFLCVGGMNAFSRKQIDKVIHAFRNVSQCQLTVTNQGDRSGTVSDVPSHITYIETPLTHAAILDYYRQCDMVIQVSTHEGLGLGFYEALEMGKPLLTLNTLLYRDIAGDAALYIPATYVKNIENTEAIVPSYQFNVEDLTNAIRNVCAWDIHDWEQIHLGVKTQQQKYSVSVFCNELCKTLW